jgi:hypothetical protein
MNTPTPIEDILPSVVGLEQTLNQFDQALGNTIKIGHLTGEGPILFLAVGHSSLDSIFLQIE